MLLKELIAQYLEDKGVANATGVKVTIDHNETLVIVSDSHPALDREIDDTQEVAMSKISTGSAA